jgi:uncharacterized protein YlxP (DUF503 family)
MSKPNLTFFTELSTQPLKALFKKEVIKDLQTLDAAVSLGILDLSDDRAEVVRRLNKAEIPVIAWLLLPEEEGYWFNSDNYQQAAARYVAFKAWTTKHDLEWAGVGVDIEMDIQDLRRIKEQKKHGEFASKLFTRYMDKRRVSKARQAYQALVDLIHTDGYRVESYHLPIISEERRAHSTVLQRTIGLVDLKTDCEVLMLYSSFYRPDGAAVLWSYAPEADSVGVGNTGGGVEVEGVIDLDPLNWEEFSRDLRLCALQQKPIHIFCLEGCVEQGFLKELKAFDWDKPVSIPDSLTRVRAIRTGIAAGLWLLERPWVILITLAALIGLGFLFKGSQEER